MKGQKVAVCFMLAAVLIASGCTAMSQNDAVEISEEVVDWTTRFSPDIPYYNISGSAIDVRSGLGAEAEVIGRLSPNDGGFIKGCGPQALYCEISYGGYGATGWVDMSKMGGNAS